jgi:hypothetical protein
MAIPSAAQVWAVTYLSIDAIAVQFANCVSGGVQLFVGMAPAL